MKKYPSLHQLSAIVTILLLVPLAACNAQVAGCTDPKANNYDPSATSNDGSCTYDPYSVSPVQTDQLDPVLNETSGLTLWEDLVWTHNDSDDNHLYGLDGSNGEIKREEELVGAENYDWEEIDSDAQYIYVGDIGNNSGNRTDLHILRVEKSSLGTGSPVYDTIRFSYEDQVNFNPGGGQNTDFDCEAFVVTPDSIYLFTKQWISKGTTVYAIPNSPGTHVAQNVGTYYVAGLVTGATYLPEKRLLVLIGYTGLLSPFFHLCYDFRGHDFFSGNNRRITVSLPFHQFEGIVTGDGLEYYASNEANATVLVPARFHKFDLSDLLEQYLLSLGTGESYVPERARLWPSPAGEFITVELGSGRYPAAFEIIDAAARVVRRGILETDYNLLNVSDLNTGSYTFRFPEGGLEALQFMKE